MSGIDLAISFVAALLLWQVTAKHEPNALKEFDPLKRREVHL
jgi:hypothetical protein